MCTGFMNKIPKEIIMIWALGIWTLYDQVNNNLLTMEETTMGKSQNVPIMLTIPKSYRDLLRTLAAEENLKNPNRVMTGSHLAKQFLCDRLDKYVEEKAESRSDERT